MKTERVKKVRRHRENKREEFQGKIIKKKMKLQKGNEQERELVSE